MKRRSNHVIIHRTQLPQISVLLGTSQNRIRFTCERRRIQRWCRTVDITALCNIFH